METGYDNVDLAAAGALGIPVTSVPEFYADEVADHPWALLRACWRKLPELDRQVRARHWDPIAILPEMRSSRPIVRLTRQVPLNNFALKPWRR